MQNGRRGITRNHPFHFLPYIKTLYSTKTSNEVHICIKDTLGIKTYAFLICQNGRRKAEIAQNIAVNSPIFDTLVFKFAEEIFILM